MSLVVVHDRGAERGTGDHKYESLTDVSISARRLPYRRVGYGVTANIAASHAAARGSIPRIRVPFFVNDLIFP